VPLRPGRKLVLAIVNILCIAALLAWASREMSAADVSAAMLSVPTATLATVVALNLCLLLLYGMRVSVLAQCAFRPALATVWLGFGLNGMLPMRLGDVAKLVYARQLFGIPTSRMAVVAAFEKLLDLAAILLLGLVVLQFVAFAALRPGMYVLAAVLVAGIAVVAAVVALPAGWIPLKGRISHWLEAAMQAVRGQLNARSIGVVTLQTAVLWALTVVTAYAMFAPLYPNFRWADAGLLTLILVLAVAIPGAPAGLGTVEAGIAGYLHTMLAVPIGPAVGAALIFHLAYAVPQVLGAIAILLAASRRRR
jgi:uncharacterized membrane protein YbhN (UPF0104 family)